MQQKPLKVMIYSPDSGARVRLKDALSNLVTLKLDVDVRKNWREAVSFVSMLKNVSLIFVHSSVQPEELKAFQDGINNVSPAYRPSFVITLRPEENVPEVISKHLMNGIEGFLSEPFTTGGVEDTLRVVLENRDKRIEAHKKAKKAIQLIIKDSCAVADETALERLQNDKKGGGVALKRMREIESQVRQMKGLFTESEIFSIVESAIEGQASKLNLQDFMATKPKVKFAPHPSKVVTKIIESRSISREKLLETLAVHEEEISALLEKQGGITPELAKSLARVLGSSEDYWLGLQKSYEAYMESRR